LRGRAALLGALLFCGLWGCGGAEVEVQAPPRAEAERGPGLRFSYESVSGAPLTDESLRGRISVIALITTYDVASQGQTRFLSLLHSRHTPRLNVALLVLEQAENKPLVEAFASSLGLPYPVAMADEETIAGKGPFAELHHVPSVIILDKQGREAYRHVGLMELDALEKAVREVEAGR